MKAQFTITRTETYEFDVDFIKNGIHDYVADEMTQQLGLASEDISDEEFQHMSDALFSLIIKELYKELDN